VIEPSHRSAAIAGAWSALGLVPADAWLQNDKTTSGLLHSLLWLLMLVVFFVVPFYYLVIGSNARKFTRLWFLDSEERGRYGAVAKRGFIWFVSCVLAGTLWSLLLSLVWRQY
jgi:hypothetical protein